VGLEKEESMPRRIIFILVAALFSAAACAGCKTKKVDEAGSGTTPEEASGGTGEAGQSGGEEGAEEAGTKVLMIIACSQFRDEELAEPREVFEKEGFEVTVASEKTEGCEGMMGAAAKVDGLLGEMSAKDFDAVVFVGGTGAKVFFEDADAHRVAREADEAGKVLAAICIAPSILAKAGVLKGKKATVWEGDEYVGILKDGGSVYEKEKVVVDGRIVTGNGPDAARAFGEKIAELLRK
jgi:protease I